MKALWIRASAIAAVCGASAALFMVLVVYVSPNEPQRFAILLALLLILCPSWSLFWAGIGEPHNTQLWAILCIQVIVTNALLYVPIGLAYVASMRLPRVARYAVRGLASIGVLAAGHFLIFN